MSEDDQGSVFGPADDDVNTRPFLEEAQKDRHHFRFIVSPEDGTEMAELKPFIRDLMSEMETDLGSRLDWVAAVHQDTAHPHAHIVLRGRRDDGTDLVISRAYISHGIRERAADLVTLELGPETVLESRRKLARETRAERFTRIDRFLLRQASKEQRLALKDSPPTYRALHVARLKTLERLGLADKTARGVWQLDSQMEPTLRKLGERRDIIRAMNQALTGKAGRRFEADAVFDRGDHKGRKVTGAILMTGVRGEGHDQAFVILDAVDGRAVYAEIGDASRISELKRGSIVTLTPPDISVKPSDRTIATIATKNEGSYSSGLHQQADPKASPEFIAAHLRRLESMRRAGIAKRRSDGTWSVPENYLDQVEAHQSRLAEKQPVNFNIESRIILDEQVRAVGVTWLDRMDNPSSPILGFGNEVAQSLKLRRAFLVGIGVLAVPDDKLSSASIRELRSRDLANAGKSWSDRLGKAYSYAPENGRIEGVYSKPIDRPSGRFAVIERERDFTLVPWRSVLERNRGKTVSGMISRGQVTWNLVKQRGLGR